MSQNRIQDALDVIMQYGSIDGGHHKQWVLDQVVRTLTGCPTVKKQAINCNGQPYEYEDLGESDEYREWVRRHNEGEDGPNTYAWEEGVIP